MEVAEDEVVHLRGLLAVQHDQAGHVEVRHNLFQSVWSSCEIHNISLVGFVHISPVGSELCTVRWCEHRIHGLNTGDVGVCWQHQLRAVALPVSAVAPHRAGQCFQSP